MLGFQSIIHTRVYAHWQLSPQNKVGLGFSPPYKPYASFIGHSTVRANMLRVTQCMTANWTVSYIYIYIYKI